MFQKLLGLKEDLYGYLTKEHFVRTFEEKFRVIRNRRLTGVDRNLFLFEKRDVA